MAQHTCLLALTVSHEYHDGGSAPELRFAPTKATASLMQREGLLLRPLPGGMEVWGEHRAGVATGVALDLEFDVFSRDPLLRFYTDWPLPPPLQFRPGTVMGADGALEMHPAALPSPDKPEPANWLHQPLFSVALPCGGGEATAVSYRLALAARRLHWKYYFSGSLVRRQLSIVDLDAANGAPGIEFGAAPGLPGHGSQAYLSQSALPLRKLPPQRLQLREAGKVLIRRLPNANAARLGKEQGPNGQSMIVAEIYVHQ